MPLELRTMIFVSARDRYDQNLIMVDEEIDICKLKEDKEAMCMSGEKEDSV